jgi:hypothetical protein
VFVHSGRSEYAQKLFNTGVCDHIDTDPTIFYRDQARRSAGYKFEHTHFTNGIKALEFLKGRFNMTVEPDTGYGLGFVDEQVLAGESAKTVQVAFGNSYAKTTKFVYNEATNTYGAFQYNKEYIDGTTKEQLQFENILVLYAVRTGVPGAPGGNVYHELVGENKGYYVCGGQIVPIKWTRAGDDAPFVYTLEDGTPVNLIPGKTYVGVIPMQGFVTYE